MSRAGVWRIAPWKLLKLLMQTLPGVGFCLEMTYFGVFQHILTIPNLSSKMWLPVSQIKLLGAHAPPLKSTLLVRLICLPLAITDNVYEVSS